MIVVFIVVLVVFGPQKLPELARGLGKLMAEFRKASTDFRSAFEEEMREMERQTLQAERKKAAEAVAASAAAEPSQPAALATTPGTETPANEAPPESATTEALVVSPVAEAVPHSTEESFESKTEEATAGANLQESTHDTEHPA
jgi:sec-independent protein translocase protein TatB